MNLENKVAMVTGASRGIGRETALQLARAGADLAVSARSGGLLESLAQEIKTMGRKVFYFNGDMSNETDIQQFVLQTIEKLDRIDILVNNAGMGSFHNIIDMSTETWDRMFDLNIRGLFITVREALPYLRQGGEAVVVNVASLAGKNFFAGGSAYVAAKHAVVGFSRCLMVEERKNGIRTLVICPGSVDTNFFDDFESEGQAMSAPNPEKILKPEDVASTIVHMIQMPQRACISEIDIRPSNP